MAVSTITNTITGPTGTAVASCPVHITLMPGPGFRADDSEIARTVITTTNASGVWTAALERTAGILPAGTYYRVEEKIPPSQGGPKVYNISVGASNTSLYAALITTPPTVPTVSYLTQAAGDARYVLAPGSFGSTPPESRPNTAGTGGVATSYSRSDHAHDRETTYGTAAARTALTGTDLYEGLRFRETDSTDRLYDYRAAVWLQAADSVIVADATALLAITTPYDGMLAYQLDTNRAYRYNGTVWIQVDAEGAQVLTSETTTSTSFAALATAGPVVTVRTGATAWIELSFGGSNNTIDRGCIMGFAVSGATTIAAGNNHIAIMVSPAANQEFSPGFSGLLTGLTPGVNVFTSQYRVHNGSGTATFARRNLRVTPIH